MFKAPKNPDEIFQEFTDDYKKLFGDNLLAIILFGSAARGDYVRKRSDINFLIVLREKNISDLQKVFPLIPKWRRRQVPTPLIVTQQYIRTALDSYPIEFLTMKLHHQLVYGEDVLAEIAIKPDHLRLQCERELRGKLLHLEENYLNTRGKPKRIKQLLRLSLPAFVSIFSALLYLMELETPASKQQILQKTAEVFELDRAVFDKIFELQKNKTKLNRQEINQLVTQYIEQISILTDIVDKLNFRRNQ